MFDPYSKWLGIPAGERPPTYYDLLDIDPDESDAGAIEDAANQRILDLKPHRKGPQAEECRRILDEIAQARDTLIEPARRRAYDKKIGLAPSKGGGKKGGKGKARPPQKKSLLVPLAIVGVVLLLAGGAVAAGVAVYLSRDKPDPQPEQVAQATQPQPPPSKPTEKPKDTPPPTKPAPPPKPADPPKPPPMPPPAPPMPPPPPKPEPPKAKLPVPDAAAQAKAEKAIKENYKADYTKSQPADPSKVKPDDILAHAAKFLQPGRENRNDSAEWFVLLREARDLSVQAEKPRLAVEAIHEIDRWFIIDVHNMILTTLNKFVGAPSEAVQKSLAQVALAASNQALSADQFGTAMTFVKVAESAADKSKTKELTTRAESRRAEIEDVQKGFSAVEAARRKLDTTPADAEANLTVGKHLCFASGKWDEGLPLLVKGGDADVKALAEKDLAKPAVNDGIMGVADGWFDYAISPTLKHGPRAKAQLMRRAKMWYERVDPRANADARRKVTDRRNQIAKQVPASVPRLLPGSFMCRTPEDKILLLREGGGTMQSEEAVAAGLRWLSEHQHANGRWTTDLFHQSPMCKEKCSEWSTGKHDIAGTAFGLLPFLGAGETHQKGPYARNVRLGLDYLVAKQNQTDGNFSGNMYEHGLATIAMVEAYAMTRDTKYKKPAEAGLLYIILGQFQDGSWGYSAKTKGDTSVSGWQFTALKTGFFAGMPVGLESFARLSRFLDSVAEPGGLGYGYNTPGAGNATSAVGLLLREFTGWSSYSPDLTKAIDRLAAEDISVQSKPSIYYLYYATQMMHHYGGPKWLAWNAKVREKMISLQDTGNDIGYTHQKGSWSPFKDSWADQGGRLMYTSFALLALETYYHHVPLNGYGSAVTEE